MRLRPRRLKIEFVEKDFGELLRRIDVEFEASEVVDGFFELARFPRVVRVEMRSRLRRIDAHAGALPSRARTAARGKSIFS